MNINKKLARALGLLIFAIGVLLGMILLGVTVWGDLEASTFDVLITREAGLTSLKCPVIMTKEETGTVSATFDNPADGPRTTNVRVHITQGYVSLMREIRESFELAPGETKTSTWTVTSEDMVYGRLILVRVTALNAYPLPDRQGSCGILVVDVSFLTGNQIYAFTLIASLLGMVIGTGLWMTGNRPLKGRTRFATRAMNLLAVIVLAGLFISYLGRWELGIVLFVVAVLFIGAIISYFLLEL
jgi:hypothetical protein